MFTLIKGKYTLHTAKSLGTIPITPRGTRSNRWKGIQHGELIGTTLSVLQDEYAITPGENPQFLVSPSGAVMLGGFTLHQDGKPWSIPNTPHETHHAMGIFHANNSTRAVTCSIGGRVVVCENGLITGEHVWRRLHTSGLRLREFVQDGLSSFFHRAKDVSDQCQALSEVKVSPHHHDAQLLQLGRSNTLPWRLLEDVDRSWNAGIREETPFSHQTQWDWLNTVTGVIKNVPPIDQPRSLYQAFQIANRSFGRTAEPNFASAG